ncbi:MAG: hypothetical protein D6731_19075, partial [Planctomycetota bacterium]
PAPRLALARADLQEGALDSARRRLEELLAASPRLEEARALLADVEARAGNFEAARDLYRSLLGGPLEAHAHLGIRDSHLDEGHGEKALAFARTLTEGLAPADPRRWALEGAVLQELGRFDEARALLDRLLADGRPRDRRLWRGYLALLELDRGDLARAAEAFAARAAEGPGGAEDPELALWGGVAAAERGDEEAARAAWSRGAAAPDLGATALYVRACRRLLGQGGREELLAALRLADRRTRGDALFVEGLALERAGRAEEALAAYREAIAAERPGGFPARLAARAIARLGG